MIIINKQKAQLRDEIKQLKTCFTPEELLKKSETVIKNLVKNPLFRKSNQIMLYWSLPDEVSTHQLIYELVGQKSIILPSIINNNIEPVGLQNFDDLIERKYHIKEPKKLIQHETLDLIIVPGLAFDKYNNRLGRGKGYYDHFLKQYTSVPKIGICFDFQLVETVPTDKHDCAMTTVISEQ